MATFLANWSRTRIIADSILAGPRSTVLHNAPGASNDDPGWFEQVIRITRRKLNPLFVEALSILMPARISEQDAHSNLVALLRICHWDGESDRQRCKSGWPASLSIHTECRQVLPERVASLDLGVRQLDEALGKAPFPIEGILQHCDRARVAQPEEPVPTAINVRMRLWRRAAFQSVERAWQSADPACRRLSQTLEGSYNSFIAIASTASLLAPVQYTEQFEEGSDPEALRKLFQS